MPNKYDDMSFGKAFAAARKAKGSGKTFTWQGKSYSTNIKEEGLPGKRESPQAVKSSPRPRARPNNAQAVASSPRPAPRPTSTDKATTDTTPFRGRRRRSPREQESSTPSSTPSSGRGRGGRSSNPTSRTSIFNQSSSTRNRRRGS